MWCTISSSFTSFQSVITYNLANPGYYVFYYANKNKESLSSGEHSRKPIPHTYSYTQ